MLPRVWALCPFSRPERLSAVLGQFRAQTYQNKGLVLVENGKALGACSRAGVKPTLLLQSEQHQSAAKNVGLAALSHTPDDWFVTWDDDDYRGPGALAEVAEAAEPGVVVGKTTIFMRLTDGRLVRFQRPGNMLWGGTLAARVGDAVSFDYTGRWGEDERWLAQMRSAGFRAKALSEWHFIAERGSESHAWVASDLQVLNAILGDRPNVIAEDFGIVANAAFDDRELPEPTRLPPRSFNWELARSEMAAAVADNVSV